MAHGGVLMTMLDVAMAQAARSAASPATIARRRRHDRDEDQFMRPGRGRAARRAGKLLHRTSTLAFCEARCSTTTAQLCAHATGTFKYLRALPSGQAGVNSQRRNASD